MTPEQSKQEFLKAKEAFMSFILALRAEAQAFEVIENENMRARICLN